MTGLIVTLMLLGGIPMLIGAQSRISRLELRLALVEDELRRRIAAEERPAADWSAADMLACTPVETELEPQSAAIAAEQESQVQPPLVVPDQSETVAAEPPAPDTPTPDVASANTPQAVSRRASINFEELFGRRLPIWAGGITLAIAGILIVKYAIDAGFLGRIFTPGVQVICGTLFGIGLIGAAEWAHRQQAKVDDPRVSQALSGAGISTLYAAFLVAANVYHLISPLAAFLGLAGVTASALWLSLRHGTPSVLLGLAGGLAAPALTLGLDANVPMLSVYLVFTIAGLVGVSRSQRWPWLALMALTGGAGWGLWLILAGQALTILGALSIGMVVLLLAIALPLFAFAGARGPLLRSVSALIGAAQLALLVATGGYQALHWGLFALIAGAGQWLAWRGRDFSIVPTLGAALAVLLLLFWPAPDAGWFALVGLSLAAIHGLPLLVKLWRSPGNLQDACELAAIAAAMPMVTLAHFHAPWSAIDVPGALAALGGALLALVAAGIGWNARQRDEDMRFALLVATGAALLSMAAWLGVPHWQAPLWISGIVVALLHLSKPARDHRIEIVAAAFASLAMIALLGTITASRLSELQALIGQGSHRVDMISLLRWSGLALVLAMFGWRGERPQTRQPAWLGCAFLAYGFAAQIVPAWSLPLAMSTVGGIALFALQRRDTPVAEFQALGWACLAIVLLAVAGDRTVTQWQRLPGAGDGTLDGIALLRWGSVAGLGTLIAIRARPLVLREVSQGLAALLAYGAVAQVLPLMLLPLAPAVAVLGLAFWSRQHAWPRLRTACAALMLVSGAWTLVPLVQWIASATLSLGGFPMVLDRLDLAALAVLRRLLLPSLLLAGALWLLRARLPRTSLLLGGGALGIVGLVAVHSLYRATFAAVLGTDFTVYGLGQRLLWDLLLLGTAWGLWRSGRELASRAAPVVVGIAGAHLTLYSLLLHNPLWSAQAVGGWPLANLILPLFALLPACAMLTARMRPLWGNRLDRAGQIVSTAMIVLFAWATLRQGFHGSLLTTPGLPEAEDILRSLLGIGLAVSYLLWGIGTRRRDWRIASLVLMLAAVAKVFLLDASGLEGLLRIASFVALGFSLIGIGWLYSRQLKSERD